MLDLLIPIEKRACNYCAKAGKCILGITVTTTYEGVPQGMKRVSCEAGLIDFDIYSADVSIMIDNAVRGKQRVPAIRPAEDETERLDSLERAELKTLRNRVSEQRHKIARLHDANNEKAKEITYLQDQHRKLADRLLEVEREQFLKEMKATFMFPDDGTPKSSDPSPRLGLSLGKTPKPAWTGNEVVVDIEKEGGAFLGIAINGVPLPGVTGYSLDQNFGAMPTLCVEFSILPRNITIREMVAEDVEDDEDGE
jgi:uncharacterized coiled-coil protein SlyX